MTVVDGTPALALSEQEARERLKEFGANDLAPETHHSGLLWVVRFFLDPMVLLLLIADGTYVFLGDRFDAAVALAALVPIFLVTSVLERRSERALAELRRLASPTARVIRGGKEQVIEARLVVPGDVVLVREGDVFVADGVLTSGGSIVVDESMLTGESQPITKEPTLGEVFAGTALRSGRGSMLVTATGSRTQYGRIGKLLSHMHVTATPIERTIHRLVWQTGTGVLVLCAVVVFIEHGHGSLWPAAIIAGVSLAMAAIPEELPMVYTLYLALGAWRLAKRHALVRRLVSVETLGAANVICVDKTGTLTYGALEVSKTWHLENVSSSELLVTAARACDPNPFDPLDIAVLRFGRSGTVDLQQPHQELLVRYPFDPQHRRVTHVWADPSGYYVATKGAVENVLDLCNVKPEERERVLQAHREFARDGMRVIAVAAAIRNAPGKAASRMNRICDFWDCWLSAIPSATAWPRPSRNAISRASS